MATNHIKQALNRDLGTEGSLLLPKKIFGTIVEEAEKRLIPREAAALYFGPEQIPGPSIDVNLEDPNTGTMRPWAEGSAVNLDNGTYSSFNMKPVKYGAGLKITRELMEDSQFPLLERQVRLFGKRAAENENSLIISDALDNAGNTVAGGATVTHANFVRAVQYLEDNDYELTHWFLGTEVMADVRNTDLYTEYDKAGDADIIKTGYRGVILGGQVVRVSTNAGMTTTTAYGIDREHAYAIAEKRRLTIEKFNMPQWDMEAAVLSHRFKARHVRANAIVKITSS